MNRVGHPRSVRQGPDALSITAAMRGPREVATMTAPHPGIGDWYRLNGGQLFEVVAVDDDDGTIEMQYFDGTVEEMDVEDWETQWDDGGLEAAEPPEDWKGSVDVEGSDED